MEIALTKMSSKGQIVIPSELRKDIKKGEKFIIIENEGKLILERVKEFDKKLEEDLEFARRTEEAWKEIEAGKFTIYSKDKFLKKLKR